MLTIAIALPEHGRILAFARASMAFDDGRGLTSTLIRSCRVRR